MITLAFFIDADTHYHLAELNAAIYLKACDPHGTELELVLDTDPDEVDPDVLDEQANRFEAAAADFVARARAASAAMRRSRARNIRQDKEADPR